MINWENEINTIIKNIGRTFQKDELAFLALTSKIEFPLRDKIAFELQKKFSNKIICREWTNPQTGKRTDIAIMNIKGEAECVIEFKAHSDMIDIKQWASDEKMKNDIEKSLLISNNPEVYFVLFINYITQLPTLPHHNNIIKYKGSIQKAIDLSYNRDKIITEWNNALKENNFESKYEKVEINGGKYFNSEVSVLSLLHGPFKNNMDETKLNMEKKTTKTIVKDTHKTKKGKTKKDWENETPKETVEFMEEIFERLEGIKETHSLRYHAQGLIGLKTDNTKANFIYFIPKINGTVIITFEIERMKDMDGLLEKSGIKHSYVPTIKRYQLVITKDDFASNSEIIKILAKRAYKKKYGDKNDNLYS